jgi:hypothetical protein
MRREGCVSALWLPVLLMAALLLTGARPQLIDNPDPMVRLDEAKQLMADGKLIAASELLDDIPLTAEAYVSEEIVFTELLIAGTYLASAHRLVRELDALEQSDCAYAEWLRGERERYAEHFVDLADEYLAMTESGPALEFVRFKLPRVSEDHLLDMELYADPQILSAAITNWDDGREGLGRGLVQTQTRVSLVLSVGVHYDLDVASATLHGMSQRLRAGVPLNYPTVLDWLADISQQHAAALPALADVARQADGRLLDVLGSGLDNSGLRERARARRAEADGTADDENDTEDGLNDSGGEAS